MKFNFLKNIPLPVPFVHVGILYLMASLTSCGESINLEQSDKKVEETDITITATLPQLNDVIQDFQEITWKENASISIFDYIKNNNVFNSSQVTPSQTAVFSGKAIDSESYHAYYPYESSMAFKYSLIPFDIPMFQSQSVYGTIDMLGPLYASFGNGETDIKFNTISTIVSFVMPQDCQGIRSVCIKDNGGVPITGSFNFNVKKQSCDITESSVNKAVLFGPFESGKRYFVNVASVENLFKSGLSIEFNDNKAETSTVVFETVEILQDKKYLDLGEIHFGDFAPKFSVEDLKLPGKKGVCAKTMMSKVVAQKPYWNYTWKKEFYPDQPKNVEFIPMTWGGFNPNDVIPYIQRLVDEGKISKVLAFNEPDTKDQSNMTVDRAIELWPYLEALGIPIGSPSMATSPTGKWMTDFMKRAKGLGYRIDFICVHDYTSACNVSNLKRKIDNTYNAYEKPILLTEFAIADRTTTTIEGNSWKPEQILKYMKSALDYLENADNVLGYAWFSFGIKEAQGWPSALFDESNNLTELGEYYSNFKPNK